MRRILPLLLAAALLLSGCAAPYEEDPGVSWEEYQQSQTGQITEEAPQEEPQPEKKKRRFWPFGRKRDEE